MNFPMTIADATAEAMLIRFGKISKYMKMSEAIWLAHSEKLIKDAMHKTFELKYVMKGQNYMILRTDFNTWLLKHTL